MAQTRLNDETGFGFIFDLDGTLIDSAGQICRAVNKTLSNRGYPLKSESEIYRDIGLPASVLFADLELNETDSDEVVADFRFHLLREIEESNLAYEGALQFVRKLKDNNLFVGVATSKPTDLAKSVILNSEYRTLIDHVEGIGKNKPKPDPGMILEILSQNRLSTGVMFGDRPEDIAAANRAGLTAVGIAQSVFSKHELISAGAMMAFSDFSELMTDYEESGEEIIEYFS
jgi:HAD superfamily hydrolase (TIGR01509 family)